jgi:hypothetical protein
VGAIAEIVNAVAGVYIGLIVHAWSAVFFACVVWGLISWFVVWMTTGRAHYAPGTQLFFGSPAFTRFVVWWTTGFVVSLVFASLTHAISSLI